MTLLEVQKQMAAAVTVPLDVDDCLAVYNREGILMEAVASGLFKSTDALSSLERLEIYCKSYWFRLIESLSEDFPGLSTVLGSEAFERLARAYLDDCPSRSFTLRDLGNRLENWLQEHQDHAGDHAALALDMCDWNGHTLWHSTGPRWKF
jgi:hypothetical protein